MQTCSQCYGYGTTDQFQKALCPPEGYGAITFTLPKQAPVSVCDICLGTGIQNGAGS